tara:strand:- start:48 stop:797 length:750 start_codon:yes stop_codon:yes gene_type:complete
MNSSIPFFMVESKSVEKINTIKKVSKFEEKKLGKKEAFLMTFIREAGKASLKTKIGNIKIPIQSVIRKPIPHIDLSFSKQIVPMKKKSYDIKMIKPLKKLPVLPRLVEKHKLPLLSEKKYLEKGLVEERIIEKEGKTFFKPLENVKLKKYGILNPLIADEQIKRINCIDLEVFVDVDSYKNISTGLKFKNVKEMNNLIKKFSRIAKQKISEDNPILNAKINEEFKINANLGTDYIPGSITLVRINSNQL